MHQTKIISLRKAMYWLGLTRVSQMVSLEYKHHLRTTIIDSKLHYYVDELENKIIFKKE